LILSQEWWTEKYGMGYKGEKALFISCSESELCITSPVTQYKNSQMGKLKYKKYYL
jgi:hypothetical protein